MSGNTILFIVPVSLTETTVVETLTLDHETPNGNVYGYGHNVYVKAENCCLTREAALVEAKRRQDAAEAEEDAALDAFMAKVFPPR